MGRLRTLSKRGKFPGFIEAAEGRFTALLFGSPLDHDLLGHIEETEGGSRITFATRIQRRFPIIFWTVMILTVWPGVWMTDSMIRTYIPSYKFQTWMWYIPLTVIPLPWYWLKMLRDSKASAMAHAQELIERMQQELDGGSSALQTAGPQTAGNQTAGNQTSGQQTPPG